MYGMPSMDIPNLLENPAGVVGNQKATSHVYFGQTDWLTITANGKITRWEFWNEEAGQGAFQVWRSTASGG